MSALNVSEADIHVLGHKEVIFFSEKKLVNSEEKREIISFPSIFTQTHSSQYQRRLFEYWSF